MAFYFSYFRSRDYLFSDRVSRRVRDLSQYSTIFARLADDATFYTYYTMQGNERLDNISEKLYGTPEYYWTIPLLNPPIFNLWNGLTLDTRTLDEKLKLQYPGEALIVSNTDTIAGKFNENERLIDDSSGGDASVRLLNTFPSLGYVRVDDIQGSLPSENFVLTGEETGNTIDVDSRVEYYRAPLYFVDSDDNYVLHIDASATPITIREDEIERNNLKSQVRVIRNDRIRDVVAQFIREMKRGG